MENFLKGVCVSNQYDELFSTVLGSNLRITCVCLLSTTYLSCDSGEWLELLTAFLETTANYDKVLITGDFNCPDLF